MLMTCSKVFLGPVGVRLNKYVWRTQQSGCGCELPPQKSWLDNSEESNTDRKGDYHSATRDRFPRGKIYKL